MGDTTLNNSNANSSGNSKRKSKGEDALKCNATIIGNYLNKLVLELFVSVLKQMEIMIARTVECNNLTIYYVRILSNEGMPRSAEMVIEHIFRQEGECPARRKEYGTCFEKSSFERNIMFSSNEICKLLFWDEVHIILLYVRSLTYTNNEIKKPFLKMYISKQTENDRRKEYATCFETTQHTLEEHTIFLENDEWRLLFWDEARLILR